MHSATVPSDHHSSPPQWRAKTWLITADLADTEFRQITEESWASPVFVTAQKMEPLLPLIGAIGDDPDVIRAELDYRAEDLPSRRQFDSLFKPKLYGVKEVHPTLAATILLNHAFLLSDQHGLIPFTDDERSISLMQCKLRRIKEMSGFACFKRELALGTASLAMRVLDLCLALLIPRRYRLGQQLTPEFTLDRSHLSLTLSVGGLALQ